MYFCKQLTENIILSILWNHSEPKLHNWIHIYINTLEISLQQWRDHLKQTEIKILKLFFKKFTFVFLIEFDLWGQWQIQVNAKLTKKNLIEFIWKKPKKKRYNVMLEIIEGENSVLENIWCTFCVFVLERYLWIFFFCAVHGVVCVLFLFVCLSVYVRYVACDCTNKCFGTPGTSLNHIFRYVCFSVQKSPAQNDFQWKIKWFKRKTQSSKI